MARLIDLRDAPSLPSTLVANVGDVIAVGASGAHIPSGFTALELLGPFVPALLADNGEVLSPMSAPNTVLLVARAPGHGTIQIVTGDPWRGASSSQLDIVIQA